MKMKILFKEQSGITREDEPVTFGVPFPCGEVWPETVFKVVDSKGRVLPYGLTVSAMWHDGSIKWGLFDLQVSLQANADLAIEITEDPSRSTENETAEIQISENSGQLEIVNLGHKLTISCERELIINRGGEQGRFFLLDRELDRWPCIIDTWALVHDSFLKKTLEFNGAFTRGHIDAGMRYVCRIHIYAGKPWLKLEFCAKNPKAAYHPGGAWDLGDKNSYFFKEMGFVWQRSSGDGWERAFYVPEFDRYQDVKFCQTDFCIYQDSSGYDNWQSNNHIDKDGKLTVSFKGYNVLENGVAESVGDHALPFAGVFSSENKGLFCYCDFFWQNFPKAVAVKKDRLVLSMFPLKHDRCYELQPGEQKTHTFFTGECNPAETDQFLWLTYPLVALIDPPHSFKCFLRPRPVPVQDANESADTFLYEEYVDQAIQGDHAFYQKNVKMDEFGWRNFGDVAADHEAVFFKGSNTFISHYNNQYDVIKGGVLQFLRSGQPQWFKMAKHMADHVADIDIYHTTEDKYQLNQGMFWHTDHHLDAATSSHRTISICHRTLKPEQSFGGGPAPDHNYSTGFLYLYWLTGERLYYESVLDLASNIDRLIQGPDTLCEVCLKAIRAAVQKLRGTNRDDPRNYQVIFKFNGPGRASGNALNTLLDAYLLTSKKHYLDQAEKLIGMCVSPKDDFDRMDLLNVELRWMYTIFLQALGRYLEIKKSMKSFDNQFRYARAVLVNYAGWMADNEYPYLEKPEILEFPNETWAAQEIRKSDIFAIAAWYAPEGLKEQFVEKSHFFYKKVFKQLQQFETRYYTRPLAIVMTNGMPYLEMIRNLDPLDKELPDYDGNWRSTEKRQNLWAVGGKIWKRLIRFSPAKEINWIKLQLRSRM